MRYLLGNFVDARHGIGHFGFVREGEGMQNGVRRAAHCHIERKSVVDGFGGDDVTRFDVFF